MPENKFSLGTGLYVYAVGPIDYWNGWTEISTLPNQADDPEGWCGACREDVDARLSESQRIARKYLWWEGDIRPGNGPYWAPLPLCEYGDFEFMVAWKQDNNGQTFVASPFRLAWLESDFWPRWDNGVWIHNYDR